MSRERVSPTAHELGQTRDQELRGRGAWDRELGAALVLYAQKRGGLNDKDPFVLTLREVRSRNRQVFREVLGIQPPAKT